MQLPQPQRIAALQDEWAHRVQELDRTVVAFWRFTAIGHDPRRFAVFFASIVLSMMYVNLSLFLFWLSWILLN